MTSLFKTEFPTVNKEHMLIKAFTYLKTTLHKHFLLQFLTMLFYTLVKMFPPL